MDGNRKIDFLIQNGVDANKGISNMMDIETYNEIMDDFYNGLDEELAKINNFKNMGDMPNYAILVHALKSNCRSLGITEFAGVAYQHELKSKENDSEFVNEHFNDLIIAKEKWKQIIANYLSL